VPKVSKKPTPRSNLRLDLLNGLDREPRQRQAQGTLGDTQLCTIVKRVLHALIMSTIARSEALAAVELLSREIVGVLSVAFGLTFCSSVVSELVISAVIIAT
jgi:hypothetical protein